jgi:hypothetical protein
MAANKIITSSGMVHAASLSQADRALCGYAFYSAEDADENARIDCRECRLMVEVHHQMAASYQQAIEFGQLEANHLRLEAEFIPDRRDGYHQVSKEHLMVLRDSARIQLHEAIARDMAFDTVVRMSCRLELIECELASR